MWLGAADEEQHDAVDVVVFLGGNGAVCEEARQGEADERQRARVQEIAAGDTIAEGSGTFGVESEHEENTSGNSGRGEQHC